MNKKCKADNFSEENNIERFIPDFLSQAEECLEKSGGDYPSVIYSMCHSGARLALENKLENQKAAMHLILYSFLTAIEETSRVEDYQEILKRWSIEILLNFYTDLSFLKDLAH